MISCSAKILLILLQNYSNPLYAVTVKLYSSTKSNRMSSRNLPNFFNIFQRFLVQLTCIYNDPYEFDLIEPNSELHRNIEKFGLIKFGSNRLSMNILEFHCTETKTSRMMGQLSKNTI